MELGINIVVISYELLEELKELVESIKRYTTIKYTLTIVDNKSSNKELINYLSELPKRLPNTEVIFNEDNRGYSKAVNSGAKLGGYKYLLILNNDVLLTEGWDKSSVSFMENHPSCGLLGYKLVDKKGVCKGCGVGFDNILRGWNKSLDIVDIKYNIPEKVKYVGGSAMFVSRQPFEHIGGLNEEYDFYCEDLQLSLDFQKLGFSTYYLPHLLIHEHEKTLNISKEATRTNRAAHFNKSLKILRKNFPGESGIAEMEK